MYVEFGATSTDTITLTNTYASTTSAKTFNILARQISCTARWKAPTDCVQYHTGTTGTVKPYNFAGGQLLQSQQYQNCIRTEKGYCRILWKESSTTSPDPFDFGVTPTSTAGSGGATAQACPLYVWVPNLSSDGIKPLPIPPAIQSFQSKMCGTNFGIEAGAISTGLVSAQQPFVLGVYTDTTTLTSPTTGFNLDYTQLPC